MGQPTPIIEIAPGVGALTDPTALEWVDITADVRALSWDRGRSTELGRVQPGSMSVVLDNSDRKFDPTHAGGAFFGDLVPRMHIRFRATWLAVEYDVFRGFVSGWPQQWDLSNVDSTVTVDCYDVLELFNRAKLRSPWEYLVESLAPSGWWRMSETSGGVMVDSSGNGLDGEWRRGAVENVGGPIVADEPDGTRRFPGVGSPLGDTPFGLVPLALTSAPYTFACWMRLDARSITPRSGSTSHDADILGMGGQADPFLGERTYGLTLAMNTNTASTGTANFVIEAAIDNGTGGDRVVALLDLTYAQAESLISRQLLVAITVSTTAVSLWVGPHSLIGVPLDPPGFILVDPVGDFVIGAARHEASTVVTNIFATQIDADIGDLLYFDSELSESDIDLLRETGTTPWDGDLGGARIQRALDTIGWPATLTFLGAGVTRMGPASVNDRTALDAIRTVVDSEQGQIYANRAGTFVFRDRQMIISNLRSTASQATFSDSGVSGTQAVMTGFEFDDTSLVNQAVVKDSRGVIHQVDDTASQDLFGVFTESIESVADEEFSKGLAAFRVAAYKDPLERVEAISPAVMADDALWPVVLAREIGDRVTVERTPQEVGVQWTAERIIEGISGRVVDGGEVWEMSFQLGFHPTDLAGPWFTWFGDGATQGWGAGKWFF